MRPSRALAVLGLHARLAPAPLVPVPASLDACRALLAYQGPARELVAQIKYRNARAPLRWLARGMATLVRAARSRWSRGRPPPPSAAERGFDQAELLARRVARELGVPCRGLLARAPGPAQTGRSLDERRTGPAFRPVRPVPGGRVAVVDDVVTTGATLGAAGRALRAAGAGAVVGVAAAHPP
ncbi:MAG: phosphoribosyltransferase family protein [Acidimicrobiales bacterium]